MNMLIALVLLALPFTAEAAEPLGRLFFTPEQRAQLDQLRIRKVVSVQTKEEPPPEVISYDGIVRRSDGKATVWVNNKALSESDVRDASSLVGRIERDGRILVQTNQGTGTPALRLKVGQSAELLSGRVDERFAIARPEQERGAKPEANAPQQESQPAENPAAKPVSQEIPPEIMEALRQAAMRAREKKPEGLPSKPSADTALR